MSASRTTACLLAGLLTLPGCATKTYGRLEPVGAAEEKMDCKALDEQIGAAQAFRDAVNRKSAFDGADVLAFLIDFGIGNHMEKEAALKSAENRTAALLERRKAAHCGEPSMQARKSTD